MAGTIVLPRRRALAFAAAGGLGLALAAWRVRAEGEPRTIAVVAKRFTYDPDEIHLKVGESVALEMRSLDVVMGFNCPDLKLRTDILPGRVGHLQANRLASAVNQIASVDRDGLAVRSGGANPQRCEGGHQGSSQLHRVRW